MNNIEIPIEKSVIGFWEIPYERKLEERGLYPFSSLNFMSGGMELHEISLIAGEAGSGKTTLVSTIITNMLRDGEKIFCVYGESTKEKQAMQTYRQMTPYGDDTYTKVEYYKNNKRTNISQYFVSETAEKTIKETTKDKLYYYDTRSGMSIPKIIEAIEYSRVKYGIKYALLDNLTQIEIATDNEVREVKDGMELLRRYVIEHPIHIIVLAHYRKSADYSSLRRHLGEVMGTSAIGQKVATAMNIIRLDNVDRSNKNKSYQSLKNIIELHGWDLDRQNNKGDYEITAVIELMKTRFERLGFVCLGFNRKTQTFFEIKKHFEKDKDSKGEQPILYENKSISEKAKSYFEGEQITDNDDLPF